MVVVLNFSEEAQETELTTSVEGMEEVFTGETGEGQSLTLEPYGYRVYASTATK